MQNTQFIGKYFFSSTLFPSPGNKFPQPDLLLYIAGKVFIHVPRRKKNHTKKENTTPKIKKSISVSHKQLCRMKQVIPEVLEHT